MRHPRFNNIYNIYPRRRFRSIRMGKNMKLLIHIACRLARRSYANIAMIILHFDELFYDQSIKCVQHTEGVQFAMNFTRIRWLIIISIYMTNFACGWCESDKNTFGIMNIFFLFPNDKIENNIWNGYYHPVKEILIVDLIFYLRSFVWCS